MGDTLTIVAKPFSTAFVERISNSVVKGYGEDGLGFYFRREFCGDSKKYTFNERPQIEELTVEICAIGLADAASGFAYGGSAASEQLRREARSAYWIRSLHSLGVLSPRLELCKSSIVNVDKEGSTSVYAACSEPDRCILYDGPIKLGRVTRAWGENKFFGPMRVWKWLEAATDDESPSCIELQSGNFGIAPFPMEEIAPNWAWLLELSLFGFWSAFNFLLSCFLAFSWVFYEPAMLFKAVVLLAAHAMFDFTPSSVAPTLIGFGSLLAVYLFQVYLIYSAILILDRFFRSAFRLILGVLSQALQFIKQAPSRTAGFADHVKWKIETSPEDLVDSLIDPIPPVVINRDFTNSNVSLEGAVNSVPSTPCDFPKGLIGIAARNTSSAVEGLVDGNVHIGLANLVCLKGNYYLFSALHVFSGFCGDDDIKDLTFYRVEQGKQIACPASKVFSHHVLQHAKRDLIVIRVDQRIVNRLNAAPATYVPPKMGQTVHTVWFSPEGKVLRSRGSVTRSGTTKPGTFYVTSNTQEGSSGGGVWTGANSFCGMVIGKVKDEHYNAANHLNDLLEKRPVPPVLLEGGLDKTPTPSWSAFEDYSTTSYDSFEDDEAKYILDFDRTDDFYRFVNWGASSEELSSEEGRSDARGVSRVFLPLQFDADYERESKKTPAPAIRRVVKPGVPKTEAKAPVEAEAKASVETGAKASVEDPGSLSEAAPLPEKAPEAVPIELESRDPSSNAPPIVPDFRLTGVESPEPSTQATSSTSAKKAAPKSSKPATASFNSKPQEKPSTSGMVVVDRQLYLNLVEAAATNFNDPEKVSSTKAASKSSKSRARKRKSAKQSQLSSEQAETAAN
jgi:hypothetical protein